MSIALPCIEPPFDVDGDAHLILKSARMVEWPHTCGPENNNGLKVDPVRGIAWVAPEQLIKEGSAAGDSTTLDNSEIDDDLVLSTAHIATRSRICTPSLYMFISSFGYVGFSAANGNWWGVKRVITVKHDGVPVAAADDFVASVRNSGATIVGNGATIGGEVGATTVTSDTLIEIDITHTLQVLGYTSSVSNAIDFRGPSLRIVVWSKPS